MATKRKTKPQARKRTAPAAPEELQPVAKATAAPEPAPVMVEPVGLRTPPGWNRRDVNPRPAGELTRRAILVRGVKYVISYSTGPVVFDFGEPVLINESEFARLSAAIDKVDFQDPDKAACTVRSIMKFRFESLNGEAIEMPAIPDVEGGPHQMSAGDRAEWDRRFEGSQHTRR